MKSLLSLASDRSAWGILGSNLLTAVVAVWQNWSVLHLLWPYWIQSVIIGVFAIRRILALNDVCVEGLPIRPVEATPESRAALETIVKAVAAAFFASFYGSSHFVFFIFLIALSFGTGPDGFEMTNSHTSQIAAIDFILYFALGVSFWFSHQASFAEHLEADLKRKPVIRTLMSLPLARIIPMHLVIIVAAATGGGRVAVLFFILLKTGADVFMHKAEHMWLQSQKGT